MTRFPMMPLLSGSTLLLLLVPALALAHTGVGETAGFVHGFGHPAGGADHLLAMLAVGLWAAQSGGRALWAVPGAFVAAMAAGGALGFLGAPVPFIEGGILVSVLVLGLLVAGAFRMPPAFGAVLAGVFAVFHGVAHGAEMPAALGAAGYIAGFVLATVLLHATGMAVGLLVKSVNLHGFNRVAGGAIVFGGIWLALA